MPKPNTPQHISYGVLPIYINKAGVKEYLLLQNHGGYWGFPKGHPEPGETPQITALREAKEEAKLEVDAASLNSPVHYDYEQPIQGAMQPKRVVLFPARVYSRNVTIQNKEIQAAAWVPYEQAIALIDLPGIRDVLRHVQDE